MKKRPLIYVRQVTNLSDARYCAGMGVDLLGFAINPDHENYVSPKQYQEMSGWFAGPRRAVEISSLKGVDLSEVILQYAPDILHVSLADALAAELHTVPLLIETHYSSLGAVINRIREAGLNASFILVTGLDIRNEVELPRAGDGTSLLVSAEGDWSTVAAMLATSGAAGFSLSGSREQTPGLKDYDHLSSVLEKFES